MKYSTQSPLVYLDFFFNLLHFLYFLPSVLSIVCAVRHRLHLPSQRGCMEEPCRCPTFCIPACPCVGRGNTSLWGNPGVKHTQWVSVFGRDIRYSRRLRTGRKGFGRYYKLKCHFCLLESKHPSPPAQPDRILNRYGIISLYLGIIMFQCHIPNIQV